jgi:hypothetical protein
MGSKFSIVLERIEDKFAAVVIRKRTCGGTKVERRQGGFPDRESATAWAKKALDDAQAERRRKNTSTKIARKERRAREAQRDAWIDSQSLKQLAEGIRDNGQYVATAKEGLKWKADLFWREVAFRALKRGTCENHAIALANETVGKNWTQRFAKALASDLDHVEDAVTAMAVANATRVRYAGREEITRCGQGDADA